MATHGNDEREPEPLISSLQPDAEWKNIQQNTFTRWVNNHLKKVPDHIDHLESDLSDGLKLIKLVEVLAQKHVGRYSHQVKFRHQKLENVSVALKFLQDIERIKIINIDSSHIVDQNKKLILGLIWTLILHYSISVHMEDEDYPSDQTDKDKTPKQRLLQWIRRKLPDDVPVTNFTYDWNDGVALGGLVNSIAPGSIPDWRSWEPDNALENTAHAMQMANDELGIAPLITPEELINPNVDEKSVMTYLAQFPQVKNMQKQKEQSKVPVPKGKLHGVDLAPCVHKPTQFTVMMPSDDAKPKLMIQDENGADIHFILNKIPGTNNYTAKYTPEHIGYAKITLYTTSVSSGESALTDSADISVVQGARLAPYDTNRKVGDVAEFTVENGGEGPVEIVVVDGEGQEQKLAVTESSLAGSYSAQFDCDVPGLHSVNVFHKKAHIEGSPFPLRVKPKCSWEIWGRGIQPDGVRVGDKVPVYVQASTDSADVDISSVPLSIEVLDGRGNLLPVTKEVSDGRVKFEYVPNKEGPLEVVVKSDGEAIGHSPYEVSVSPKTDSPIRAFGPGLEGGIAEHANVFYVNTHGESDHLAFTIEGPSKTAIECSDRGNGVALVEYTPKESGIYKINVLSRGEHIQDSPFVVWVDPSDKTVHPSAVRVSGLESGRAVKDQPTKFRIDTKTAGADLIPQVSVIDAGYATAVPSMREVNPGLYECTFVPKHDGDHFVNVGVRGVAVPGSPFPLKVEDPVDISKLRIHGPGVEGPVISQKPTYFTIDAKQAGPGAVEVALADRQGRAVDIDVLDNQDGSFTVKYTAPRPGAYQLNVVFAGVDVPSIEINVKPHVNTAGIRVEGLENAIVTVNCEKEVHVFTSDGENTRILIRSPSGRVVEALIESTPAGFRVLFTPSEIGDYTIAVTYEDLPIDHSPFLMHSVPPGHGAEAEYVVSRSGPPRAEFVRVSGPGLGPVVATRSTHVHIDASRAGFGNIDLFVDGPTRTPIHCVDNHDGTCSMYYVPRVAGLYWLRVMFEEKHVPGSPFQVVACAPMLASPSLMQDRSKTPTNVLVGKRLDFEVDVGENQSADGGLELIVKEGDGKQYAIKMDTSADGRVHKGHYVCSTPGKTDFNLLFDDVPVKHAVVQVARGQDASQVKAVGDGLSKALVGEPAFFDINTEGAGDGGLSLEIEGPAEAATSVQDHANGSCTVEYVPKTPGVYQLGIMYGDKKEHIPGSPFTAVVDHPYVPESVRVEGIANPVARLGESSKFVVDASKTAEAPVDARLPVGQQQPIVQPISGRSRAYSVNFTPHGKPGDVLPLEIMYDGKPVNGSPFPITLLPECQAENARVTEAAREKAVYAGQEATVSIDTSQCGKVDSVRAAVTGPDGHSRRCSVTPGHADYLHDLSWPTDVSGAYNVDVFVNDQKISAEPVKVHAKSVGSKYDVIVQDKPDGGEWLIGEDKYLSVDRLVDDPNARLAILKSHPDGCDSEIVTDRSGGKVRDLVRLRPAQPGKQSVNLVYGGEIVDSGDIAFEAVKELHVPEVLAKEKELSKEPIHTKTVTTPTQKTSPTSTRIGEFPSEQRRLSSSDRRSSQTSSQYTREELIERNEKRYYGRQESTGTTASHVGSLGSPPPSLRSPTSVRSPTVHPPTSPRSATGSLQDPLYERQFNFNFDPSQIDKSKLTAEVVMPKGKDTAEIVDNSDGTVTVRYTPKVTGPHELTILHDGAILQGTPLKFFVDNYSTGYATVYGPGLTSGVVGEPCTFTVCAKGSHAKELSVSIEGAAQANIKIHDNKDGTCSVSWVPPVPGEYKVFVKLGGKDVKHSPFTVNVAGSQQKSSHLSVGSTSEVALNISETELKGVSASIKSPSGIEEPCFVRIIEGGRLGVSFTPREAGEHLISVKRNGKLVPRAPFRIKVDKSQVGDASKVVVSGPGKSKAVTMADNEILVDTSKAGYGGLSVSVQGPSKAELTCKEKQPGLIAVNYKPTEPGIYVVHIKFADHHVKDSPLTVVCTGKSAGVAQTNIEKQAAQQPIALVGQDSHMYLKLPNTNALNMVARLQNPKGMNEDVEMRDVGENFYQISFKPKMEGLHALSVLFKDHHIHGSPFNFTVGSFSEGGPHKVRASGLGVVRGETKFPNSFNIYTREAGQGKLSVAIEGPSKAKVDFKDHKDGNCHVDYTVQQPGEYKIAVKFNDQHIPDSPFKVFIAPSVGEVRKLELAQFQDQGVPVGKAFTFTVLTHRAKGNLEAKVTSPRGETETIDIVPIEEGESYAMRFIPKESGNHYVHVTLDGSPMRDSPFLLRVGGRDESDPTAIHATGEGLVHGTTGQKCEFIINTCNAGAGVLSVQMDGPSKVTLDAYELEHGYKARYTPMAPGDYICAIKYNSIHIPGSPFKIKVDGKKLGGSDYQESSTVTIDAAAKTSKGTVAVAPTYTGDASKVTVKGAGLNKFFPNRVANFQIDTGLAGPNLLFVGVVTTKGPCEEVIVKHIGNGRYVVNYKVTDRAKGFIFVKYGDEEIPGSPFAIEP